MAQRSQREPCFEMWPRGLLAAVGTDHPLELLRLDMMAGEDGAEGAFMRRASEQNTLPRPTLPATYRLAA